MISCVTGLFFGDESKGKLSDILAAEHDHIVRYAGGANAGHTVVIDGKKHKFHHLPCGVLAQNRPHLFLTNGMVINPVSIIDEINGIKDQGIDLYERLHISDKAHCVMPWHIASDCKKGNIIGTTKKGIGPCYADKAHRSYAIRMGDLLDALKAEKTKRFFASDAALHGEGLWKDYYNAAEYLQQYISDTGKLLRDAVKNNDNILFEGAQGVQLDIDHGGFPFCTSSGVGPAAIPQACGLPNIHLDRIIGVTKCYCTRVGNGPFRGELDQNDYAPMMSKTLGDEIRTLGNEFGTTTGRPRRIGWLDLEMLKESVELTGATELALMHCDTIAKLSRDEIGYFDDGGLKFHPTWRSIDDENFLSFCAMIEDFIGLPITIISYGPDRKDTKFVAAKTLEFSA